MKENAALTPAEMQSRPKCPVCCRTAPVNKDGAIRKHMRQEPGRCRMVPCEGSGTNAE